MHVMPGYKREVIACAVNRAGLNKAFEIASTSGIVVFGTMDGAVLDKLSRAGAKGSPAVYFYEPG